MVTQYLHFSIVENGKKKSEGENEFGTFQNVLIILNILCLKEIANWEKNVPRILAKRNEHQIGFYKSSFFSESPFLFNFATSHV